MLLVMATQWRSFRQFLKVSEHLVFNEAPKLVKQLQNPQTMQRNIQQGLQKGLQQGLKIGLDALANQVIAAEKPAALTAGRPVTNSIVPTAHRARKVVYAPDLDGRADPGEIVWTWVVFEEDPTRGKDRPVLVVGRDRQTLLGLMLSSQDRHSGDRDWVGIGTGPWDYEGRPSWVRLDRVLDVPEEGIRREGAIVERTTFDIVAARLRADFSWS
ncbi:type II toxin-antitoxin system PemK/MazF family toxin [soil metagenome]